MPSRTIATTIKKNLFRNQVVCSDGAQEWSDADIKRWVELGNGRYVTEFDSSVTVLVCSMDEYKADTAKVKQAKALGNRCTIVSHAWLHESLTLGPRDAKVPKDEYNLAAEAKRDAAKAKRESQAEELAKLEEDYINPRFYHIFRDDTCFAYQIIITRPDRNGVVDGDKYICELYEMSNTHLPLYWFGAQHYSEKGAREATYIRYSTYHPTLFATALEHFKRFFELNTGVSWDNRLSMLGEEPAPGRYRYQIPTDGKPVGVGVDLDALFAKVASIQQPESTTDQEQRAHLDLSDDVDNNLSIEVDVPEDHDASSPETRSKDSEYLACRSNTILPDPTSTLSPVKVAESGFSLDGTDTFHYIPTPPPEDLDSSSRDVVVAVRSGKLDTSTSRKADTAGRTRHRRRRTRPSTVRTGSIGDNWECCVLAKQPFRGRRTHGRFVRGGHCRRSKST